MLLKKPNCLSCRAWAVGSALAVLFLVTLAPVAGGWSEFGEEPKKDKPLDGPEVKEPFFQFLLAMAEHDSLGRWTSQDVRAHAAAAGVDSRFPLEDVLAVTRSRPDPAEAEKYAGATVRAVWTIAMNGPQDNPMPYSILGYHPGSLRISEILVLSELAPQEFQITYQDDGRQMTCLFTEVRLFPLEQGYVLLDADGLLDKLLGSALDDAWTVGFVVAREDGRRVGMGISLGRKGRKIYGEFDFSEDKVVTHGRGPMSGLSRFSRRWLDPADGLLPPPWVEN